MGAGALLLTGQRGGGGPATQEAMSTYSRATCPTSGQDCAGLTLRSGEGPGKDAGVGAGEDGLLTLLCRKSWISAVSSAEMQQPLGRRFVAKTQW